MQRRKGKEEAASPLEEAAVVAAVLGNDDLLHEILVRLDYPTFLVHAALVSKRWLRHASDPAFLRRFRGLHPPRVLGLYVRGRGSASRFVPLPHPRELDVVFRHASFQLGNNGHVIDCRNGRLLVYRFADWGTNDIAFDVCSPLHQPPDFRVASSMEGGTNFFLPEDGGNGMCYNVVKLVSKGKEISAEHFIMQAGAKSEVRTSTAIEKPSRWLHHEERALLVNNKCYMLGRAGYILGLDLASMCLCAINLPDGVQQHEKMDNIVLSRADGYGFYLVYLKGFQIHVWHYDDSNNAGEWKLVDTICARRAIAHLAKSDYREVALESQSSFAALHRVGDNAEFILNLGREFFHMYIGSRKVEKVFEMPQDDDPYRLNAVIPQDDDSYRLNAVIHPFTMVWPPSFPALRDEQAHEGQDE